MSHDNTAGCQPASACLGDVLLAVDSGTVLERYPDASLSADAPTPVDGKLIYTLAGFNAGDLGRNDSRLELALDVGQSIHIRGITLTLGGEHGLVLYRIATPKIVYIITVSRLISKET